MHRVVARPIFLVFVTAGLGTLPAAHMYADSFERIFWGVFDRIQRANIDGN